MGRLVEEVAALKLQCEELDHQLALADKSLEESNGSRQGNTNGNVA